MSETHQQAETIRVLMVCLGNICRSPTAHGVLAHLVASRGLASLIQVDSCGTSDYHIGDPPDPRTLRAARTRGYDLSAQRARQLEPGDFQRFDYILAMDQDNLRKLRRLCQPPYHDRLGLLLDYSESALIEVPDPYYGGPEGFEQVLDLVEEAAGNLLNHLINIHFPTQE